MRFLKNVLLVTLLYPKILTCQFNNTMSDAKEMLKTIAKLHVDYKEIDTPTSEYIFHTMLTSIDRYGLFFTSEDIEKLQKYKQVLADEIENESTHFLDEVKVIYKQRQLEVKDIVLGMKDKNFEYESMDTFYYSEKNPFVNKTKIPHKWQKWMKLVSLNDYEESLDSTNKKSSLNMAKMRSIIDSNIDEQIKMQEQRIESKDFVHTRIKNSFLSAIARSFDPHTDYFSPGERQEFEESLSANKNTFGLDIELNNENEIEITAITPGSAAWNSDEFEIGDIIVSFKPKGKKEIDFTNITLSKANGYLHSNNVEEGKFKLKKKSGQEENIDLVKTLISNDDNLINSYILESSQKMAYLALPSFYFNRETGNGCANDIARELIQLKKEGIEGLIFDLRGNGGGSMDEAIKLCGMFINYGALFIYQYREGDPATIKDMNKGIVYDGPMIVLVDKSSCSAAELFAAVMQDYNRAVIVGSNTYGKSTSQTILPLKANSISEDADYTNPGKGFIKLTIGKMYRCTGKSYQKDGVKVDVSLPDIFDHLELGEIHEPRALQAKTIDKKTYYFPLSNLPIEELKTKSKQRLMDNNKYKELETHNSQQAVYIAKKWIPVDYNGFIRYKNFMDKMTDVDTNKDKPFLEVKLPEYVQSLGKLPEATKMLREKRCKNISRDINLNEAYYILSDLYLLTKK
ncbi:MAG: carboxy terminal-processing peptidase [Chitinophagales bacterium]|nr:carboxy terminal-processing peptidase [Chitinophagales bacterium]